MFVYNRSVSCTFAERSRVDTLEAYIDKYGSLVSYLADNATGTPTSDTPPVEQTSKAISLQVRFFPIDHPSSRDHQG